MKALDELARIVGCYGRGFARRKLAVLDHLADLPSARAVQRLHELLLVLRAYPDDADILRRVDDMLDAFAKRKDTRRFRERLADSGIAGTPLHYSFYFGMAAWLCQRWPDHLQVDWGEVDDRSSIESVLAILVLHAETPALDTIQLDAREWLARFKAPNETDAAFLIRRFTTLPAGARELIYDAMDLPLRLDPGDDTPSRTRALYRWRPPVFQTRPRKRGRPSLRRAAAVPPLSIQRVSPAEGERLVDLARATMVTRQRDLDGIDWADARDVHLIDSGAGLSFASLGLRPERRLMLESIYVFVILQNGVPVGYFQAATLFGAAELNYNLFPPWRGAGAADIYARGLAMVHHWLGADVFAVDPYQLGDGNREALASGSFWFYYKLGFRPEDAERKRIVRGELRAMRRKPDHRSSLATLRLLMHDYLFFHLRARRDDVVGKLSYGEIGLAVSRYVAERFGADRERATATCSREAAERLHADTARFSAGELCAWRRWSPLVMLLDVDGWTPADKRELVAVIRAKGGAAERDYVTRFDRHERLRAALAELATPR